MSNILNHNRTIFDFILNDEDYWDFHLSEDGGYSHMSQGLSTECLSAYIDFNDSSCIKDNGVLSKDKYTWEYSKNEGVTLDYIGVTGVDNGLISYRKDRITNTDFLNLFLKSTYQIVENDMRLHLQSVNGNNQIYDYQYSVENNEGKNIGVFNGGFLQGFFKLDGKPYQVLPYVIENGWNFEIRLNKSNLINDSLTVNDVHPNNSGIFLYIGTRAENKWWEKYKVKQKFEKTPLRYNDDYVEDGYVTENEDVNSTYLQDDNDDEMSYLELVYNDNTNENGTNCNKYVDDDYLENEEEITGDEELVTSEGFDFNQPNIIQYDTDNKFLLFNRTPEGFTTKTWEEGTIVTMYDIKRPILENYHTLFNRTPNGYTIKNIDELIESENKEYNVIKDLYRNSLGFQIREDGSIGFKYLIKDCESEEENYKIEELFSKEGIIKDDEWYTINIKILPKNTKDINYECGEIKTLSHEEMYIYIYVNGMLKLKSEALPMLNLKALDDLSDKQQGVPYSLSLGGGTQGLCDVVNLNYREIPKYLLPLEKEFCGTFVGYIQYFRFYTCPLNYNEIIQNYIYDLNI